VNGLLVQVGVAAWANQTNRSPFVVPTGSCHASCEATQRQRHRGHNSRSGYFHGLSGNANRAVTVFIIALWPWLSPGTLQCIVHHNSTHCTLLTHTDALASRVYI